MNTHTSEPGQLIAMSNLGALALAFVHVSVALDSSALSTQDHIDLLQLKGGLREELVDGGHLRPLPKPGDMPPGGTTPAPGGESESPAPTGSLNTPETTFVSARDAVAVSEPTAACESASVDSSSDCSASASGD